MARGDRGGGARKGRAPKSAPRLVGRGGTATGKAPRGFRRANTRGAATLVRGKASSAGNGDG